MTNTHVIIIGGGIAGLTAGSLLAHQGIEVSLLEAHSQTGGCAGTFKRGKYIFDVGATQVAGLEKGGIHERIFRYLGCSLPKSELLNPACVVHLGDNSGPIKLWHDPEQWRAERNRQFPGSESFWNLCSQLHESNWSFAKRDPVLPIQNAWDFQQFSLALRPRTIVSGLFSRLTVLDLLRLCGCDKDLRLQKFLDLQLKLYSQESLDRTAALYGATVLQMAQKPLGLWHVEGSMQKMSEVLESSFIGNNGLLHLSSRVVRISTKSSDNTWVVDVVDQKGNANQLCGSDVIFTLPPQSLLKLMPRGSGLPLTYKERLRKLPKPSGALVLYGVVARKDLSPDCPSHIQLDGEGLGSLFLSISSDGDGRAPSGQATIIASVFADVDLWHKCDLKNYQKNKKDALGKILQAINASLQLAPDSWLHTELATPRSFAKWTGRPLGIVGGVGQHPNNFGPFGLASRTPIKGLWLCGDSIYPGEGTAGVSQSALMACRQLMEQKKKPFKLPL